jgi:hypothetical protein
MSRQILKKSAILCSLVVGLVPATMVNAQDEQADRLDGLFVQDTDDQMGLEDRRAEREARMAEFAKNNPEAAAKMQARRAEMEKKRADFEARYPEAAAELKGWREADQAMRKKDREQRDARKQEFETKYPEAAAEMKAWREQERAEHEQRRAEMDARKQQFESKYPEAAAEMRSFREQRDGLGAGERRRLRMDRGPGG